MSPSRYETVSDQRESHLEWGAQRWTALTLSVLSLLILCTGCIVDPPSPLADEGEIVQPGPREPAPLPINPEPEPEPAPIMPEPDPEPIIPEPDPDPIPAPAPEGRGLQVVLSWSSPTFADDLDLYLVHSRYRSDQNPELICNYSNPNPSWSRNGGGPDLSLDSTTGETPEHITFEEPVGYYLIGVHAFSLFGMESTGASSLTAQVRVYLDGELLLIESRELTRSGEFWQVATFNNQGGETELLFEDQLFSDVDEGISDF